MFYCNKTCQSKDWKIGHQLECHSVFFKSDSPIFPAAIQDFKYRILRLFFLLRAKPKLSQKQYKIYDGTSRCFENLLSHHKHVKEDSEFVRLCNEIVGNLKKETICKNDEANELMEHLLTLSGIFKTNAFCIYNEDKTERLGAGVYIETSVFDHSCKPTAFFVECGTQMQIRAIGPIRVNETPLISYILAHNDRETRQTILKQRYNFACHCERCENPIAEKDIDFDRMSQLLESQSHFAESETNWKVVLKTHNELVQNFRKMYHEYDERITNQFYWIFTVLVSKKSEIPNKVFDNLVQETRSRLLTTYGSQYIDYKNFEKQTAGLLGLTKRSNNSF